MLLNYSTLTKKNFVLFFFLLIVPISIKAQSTIYHHNFDTYQSTVPYTVAPAIAAPEISNSQWTNNTDTQTWNDALGITGNSLSADTDPGNTTPLTIFTLTFDVAAGQQLEVTGYQFVKMRSNFGAQNWTMYINGIMVGNGALNTAWTTTPNVDVTSPVIGLTGTVTVSIEFNNHPSGSGSIRIDNFYLYGNLTPASCPLEISSFSPSYGPANTLVTIEGTGFNDATSVTFDGIDATFAALSDTEIMALVPEGASTGEIVINSDVCSETSTSNFTVLTSECESDVYISEIFDSRYQTPGAIELYNPTSTTINLNGYTLLRYGDIGDTTPSYNMSLTGSIAPGDTYIVAIDINNSTNGCTGIPTDFNLTNGINQNDEFELLKNGVLIDNVEIPLGTSSTSGRGYTLIRKPDAIAPKEAFDVADWNVYGDEFCDDLDSHTADDIAATTPDITNPITQYICENETATFSVAIDGTGYNYQWVVLDNSGNWVNVTNNSNYSGATTDTLTITDVPYSFNGYQYYCYITSATCEIFSNSAQLNVTEAPEQPTVVVTPSDCNADTGTITVSTTSTDPILFYSIDGTNYQVNNPVFTNLAPGEYTVTVKNLSDCVSLPATATIETVGGPDVADTTVTQPSCTDPFGTITVNSPTGTIYSYSTDGVNYNTNPVITNLTPGNYIVYVQNDLGCVSETETIEIEALTTLPEPQATTIQPTCDVPTGTIEVTTPLGTEYTYSIDGTNFQSSTTFDDLAPGNYNVTLMDSSNCTAVSQNITIDNVPAPPVLGTINVTQPTCSTTGQIFVFSPLGADYTYSIDGINYQSSPVFDNLTAGDYEVTVELNTCISAPETITLSTPTPAAPDVVTTQPDCSGTVSQIEVTSPTGTGITYSIGDGNGYQSSPVFNNIAAGNYDVTIQDEDGCISEITPVTINPIPNAPDVPTLTVTAQPTCNTTTGTIEVTAPAGADIEYSIDGGAYQTSPIFNAASGTHTITVQNAAGCTSSNTITVDDLPTVAAPTYTIPALGCEDTDGTLTFTTPTGSEYEYSVDGGTTFETFTDFIVTPGNYTLVVLNTINGCVSADEDVTVLPAPNTPEQALTTLTHPTCTTATGSIEVTSPTGTDLEYSIDGVNFQSSTTFNNLITGTYNVTVQNTDGCISVSADFVINDALEVPAIATVTETQPDCTTATGSIEVTAPLGADLEYSIDGTNFQSSTTFDNLNSGAYDITVQNADGCTSVLTGVVINDAPLTPATPTVTETQPDCTTATGAIEVTLPTGTDLEYSIDGTNFQSSTTFSNLTQGTYDITVQNADGCIAVLTGVIINSAPETPAVATTTQTQPDCTSATGTIEVTSPLGADIEYSIDGINFQSSTTFTNVASGTYIVTVQNADGCTSVLTGVTIDDAPAIPAIATTTQIQPDCVVTTGTIEVTAPTGTDLEYSIDGINFQSSTTFTNLNPGTYSITTQNTEGCTSVANNIVINNIPTDPANPAVSEIQPNCFSNTGSITVTSPLGADLTYSINGVNFQSSTTFNNLNPGIYTITVKNAGNCTAELNNIVINTPPQTPATPVVTRTQPTCTVTTGTIEVTSPLGTDLEYSIDGVNYQSSTIFNNVAPGSYNITVQNAEGCTATVNNIVINAPLNIPDDATVSITHPTCNSPVGIITVTAPIGNGITYSIDGVNYQSQTTFYNVAPGSYTVYVKNAAGCISDNPPSVTVNPALQVPAIATANITNPDCENPLGVITVTSPLGTDLIYSIDNGVTYQSSPVFNDVASGTYFIRVQNGDGCTSQPYQVYVQPQPVIPTVPTLSVIQTDCDNDFGRIIVTSPIGPMNTYSIDGGANYQATTTFNNLAPGNYTVQVRNQAGCTAISDEITIDAPPAPAPDPGIITGITTICEGESTTLENTEPNGIWSSNNENIATVDQNGNVTSLKSGIVTISYTVGNICTDTAEATLKVNALPNPQLNDEYYLCFDEETEEYNPIMLSTGLSTGSYSFEWSKDGESLPFITGFLVVNEPGNYTVNVTNINTGCNTTATTTVNVSSSAIANATVGADFANNQTITVDVVGGSGDYEFSLNGSPFQDSNIFTNINEGLYTIIVNDKNGCNPIELEVYALNYPRFFSPNGDGEHDTWNINGLRNQREAIIYIYDRFGKIVSAIQPGGIGWDGTYNGERLPATDYWFTLDYQSSDGSKREFKAHFSLLR